jgi:hypothetical protein
MNRFMVTLMRGTTENSCASGIINAPTMMDALLIAEGRLELLEDDWVISLIERADDLTEGKERSGK